MSKAAPNSSNWIAGINAVASSLEHDASHVREVLIEAGQRNPRLVEIEERARQLEVPVRKVNAQAIGGVAGDLRHQGVVARYEAARPTDESELPGIIEAAGGKALLLVLDGVQDPHNLGACLRSAAAAGVTAVIIPKDKAAPLNATVRKTSAGAADRLPVVSVTNLARTLRTIKDAGVWVYGLDGEAPDSLYGVDLKGNVALVLGGEGEGMRRLTREHCDGLVRILMPGTMESLNVSVAAGIAMFEAVRQRLGHVA
jgi:23S rRNA (guanosine2251-2'-O)-methyltransferase